MVWSESWQNLRQQLAMFKGDIATIISAFDGHVTKSLSSQDIKFIDSQHDLFRFWFLMNFGVLEIYLSQSFELPVFALFRSQFLFFTIHGRLWVDWEGVLMEVGRGESWIQCPMYENPLDLVIGLFILFIRNVKKLAWSVCLFFFSCLFFLVVSWWSMSFGWGLKCITMSKISPLQRWFYGWDWCQELGSRRPWS